MTGLMVWIRVCDPVFSAGVYVQAPLDMMQCVMACAECIYKSCERLRCVGWFLPLCLLQPGSTHSVGRLSAEGQAQI